MQHAIVPVILSGGAGARLWPLSSDTQPKQFHALTGPASLFAETLARLSGEAENFAFAAPVIVSGAAHAAPVREALARAGRSPGAILLEPAPRNTAAAAAAAAAYIAENAPDALMLIAPADHLIADNAGFRAAIAAAAPLARERIITFGVAPNRPETGYGYIKRGAALAQGVFAIDSFKEKPDSATAQRYLDAGGYSWNAGLFLTAPALLLEEFGVSPQSAQIREAASAALARGAGEGAVIRLDAAEFTRAPSLPLDIAVMEKTARGAVAPCDIGWADVGSWSEIWRLAAKDGAGNVLHGDAFALDSADTLIRGEGVTVCAAGVKDLIIVATPEAVIVLPRARAQDVKALREAALKRRD